MSDPSPLQVVPSGGGRFDIVDGTRRRTAYAVSDGSETWVFLDGRVHVIWTAKRAQHARQHGAAGDDTALAAPMPSTVVSVNVNAGQSVTRGDVLVTLEAMKMELAVRAPRDGTVRRIACQPGELVQPGVPLVELE
jgi:3-methylcrotonyl-CoA carboxylase alpha subunit